ncbi:HTH-type transcriptional regulator VirS [compost metagenome]
MDPLGFAVSMVYPLRKAIARKGLSFEYLCQLAEFDIHLLSDVEARIRESELERLNLAAAKYAEDENFGLHQGQLTDLADLGILGYVMMHSERILDALQAYQRYHVILCSGYNLEWEEQGNDLVLRICRPHSLPISRYCLDDMVSSVYHLLLRMSQRPVPLRELQLTYSAPEDLSAYISLFGIEPKFGGKEAYFRMDREVLQFPMMYSDPRLLKSFEAIAEEIKTKLVRGKSWSDQLREWMLTCLPGFFPTLQQSAEAFAMSPRSLQLKLSEEGTTYQQLSASIRMEMAKAYLKHQEYSSSDIAYLLHYSEPSAFHNAFKKWTGFTPGQYRAKELRTV